tara:strand:- start:34 stop:594 length:561 start_codon:yes stop_codon:yes gene_type:complete
MLLSLFSNMKKLLLITIILLFSCKDIFGPSSCNEEIEVELWGECYNIMQTSHINLSGNFANSIGCGICNPYGDLDGPIPATIGNLTNLTVLDLSFNELTGSIPVEIGNLTNLTYLKLVSSGLTGEIPSEIGNLTNLTYLSLAKHPWDARQGNFSGDIPQSICNLIETNNLDIDDILEGNNLNNTCD